MEKTQISGVTVSTFCYSSRLHPSSLPALLILNQVTRRRLPSPTSELSKVSAEAHKAVAAAPFHGLQPRGMHYNSICQTFLHSQHSPCISCTTCIHMFCLRPAENLILSHFVSCILCKSYKKNKQNEIPMN